MKRLATALLATLLFLAAAHGVAAEPAARIEVSELKPLLLRAIEQGSAHGILTGAGADYVRRRFEATAPIKIDVRALHALPQPGCSRLEVVTRQRDVLEEGNRRDQSLTYQMSFCRDGRAPDKR
jgi:hypothetical protein